MTAAAKCASRSIAKCDGPASVINVSSACGNNESMDDGCLDAAVAVLHISVGVE